MRNVKENRPEMRMSCTRLCVVYAVRRSTFQDLYIGTAAVVIVALLVVNTAVITGCAVYLVMIARRMLS